MEFLTGGLYKGTIHRVVQPPKDQQSHTRLGVFYFCLASDHVTLAPLVSSPVLQRVGIERRCADDEAPKACEWRKHRTAAYGKSDLKAAGGNVEVEVIKGVTVKHWN